MTDHIKTKHKLQEVASVKLFEKILSEAILSDTEKDFLRMLYLEKKDLRCVADTLGMSEGAAKKRHSKILKIVASVI